MISITDVWQAKARISSYVHKTPLVHSSNLSMLLGSDVYFKCENLQKTGSFKARGAFNSILSLTPDERQKGIVCYSSGNHAQAVCYAAKTLNVEAWVYMPVNAIKSKVDACKGYGGHIVLTGSTGAEAYPKAVEFTKEHGLNYIDPVENAAIMAGQGTSGLEILEDLPDVDAVYVPVGGGGLISGIAAAIKGLSPSTKVIGVEPENMNCMNASINAGKITKIERKYSVADGLAGDAPGPMAFENASKYVDEFITVSDSEIIKAMELIMQRTKMFIEPSGAASFAGLCSGRAYRGSKNACLISGGNADFKLLSDIFNKTL